MSFAIGEDDREAWREATVASYVRKPLGCAALFGILLAIGVATASIVWGSWSPELRTR